MVGGGGLVFAADPLNFFGRVFLGEKEHAEEFVGGAPWGAALRHLAFLM